MAHSRVNVADRRLGRRWLFAGCVFDENNWALAVDGRRVAVEAKPLELLHELLLCAGTVVSKDDLLDRIWPDVTVVEASVPTAVRKLRLALGCDQRDEPIIETVSGIGYRLGVPVEVEQLPIAPLAPIAARPATGNGPQNHASAIAEAFAGGRRGRGGPWLVAASALAILTALIVVPLATPRPSAATGADHALSQRDAANALRKLDVGTIERMLAAGWDPNTPFDKEGNGAVNHVLNMCEWNRGHDQSQLLLMVRTLIDGGARLDRRNVWGDTPYSIAKAQRYCGPDHPVTRSIRTMCYAGFKPLGDRCLASYELERAART